METRLLAFGSLTLASAARGLSAAPLADLLGVCKVFSVNSNYDKVGGIAMSNTEKKEMPLMAFESDASAPILRYDVPSPSMYEGRTYVELDLPEDWFDGKEKSEKAYKKPSCPRPISLTVIQPVSAE